MSTTFTVALPHNIDITITEIGHNGARITIGEYTLRDVEGQNVKYLREAIEDARTQGEALATILAMVEDATADAERRTPA